LVWDQEVAGSNPVSPTLSTLALHSLRFRAFLFLFSSPLTPFNFSLINLLKVV